MRYADPWDETLRLERLLEADLVAPPDHPTVHVWGATVRVGAPPGGRPVSPPQNRIAHLTVVKGGERGERAH
jgi:hypothetical protein